MSSTSKPYDNYLKQEVEGASKAKLVLLLYDGTIRFLHVAVKSINEKKLEDAHNNIIKAQNIIYELMSTLNIDDGGEVAQNLLRLYDFMSWQLIEANKEKNIDKVNAVIELLKPLRGAWKEIVDKEQQKNQPQQNIGDKPHKSVNFSG